MIHSLRSFAFVSNHKKEIQEVQLSAIKGCEKENRRKDFFACMCEKGHESQVSRGSLSCVMAVVSESTPSTWQKM